MNTILARWFTPGPRSNPVDLIVVHSMESAEMGDTAESCARYFASTDRMSSAHVCVDNNSRVRCVHDHDIAYAAPGANHNGLHLELAGRASQTRDEWLDEYGQGLFDQAAVQVAEWVTAHDIPLRFVNADALQRGERGITTHVEVSIAFRRSDHWDPGPLFPMDVLLDRVRSRLLPPKEDVMPEYLLRWPATGHVFAVYPGGRVRWIAAGNELTAIEQAKPAIKTVTLEVEQGFRQALVDAGVPQ